MEFEKSISITTKFTLPDETLLMGGGIVQHIEVTTFVDKSGVEWPSSVVYRDAHNSRLYPTHGESALIEDHFVDLATGVTV